MDSEIRRLVDLTDTLSRDLADQKYDACAADLQQRDEILESLRRRCSIEPGMHLQKELDEALKQVRDMDRTIEDTLVQGLQETGREMARAAKVKTPAYGTPQSPRCFDKQA